MFPCRNGRKEIPFFDTSSRLQERSRPNSAGLRDAASTMWRPKVSFWFPGKLKRGGMRAVSCLRADSCQLFLGQDAKGGLWLSLVSLQRRYQPKTEALSFFGNEAAWQCSGECEASWLTSWQPLTGAIWHLQVHLSPASILSQAGSATRQSVKAWQCLRQMTGAYSNGKAQGQAGLDLNWQRCSLAFERYKLPLRSKQIGNLPGSTCASIPYWRLAS